MYNGSTRGADQGQTSEECRIRAWLSYRHGNPDHKAARDQLEKLCREREIELIYDKKGTKTGDDLIRFMQDLSESRFIFIFMDSDYLASPYTVHELIAISELGGLDERIVAPIRVSTAMVATEATRIRGLWNGDNDGWNELARQLDEKDPDKLAQRLDAAWTQVVYPHLDTLSNSAEDNGWETILKECLEEIENRQHSAIERNREQLRRQLIVRIERVLQYGASLVPALVRELEMQADADHRSIATRLLDRESVSNAISALTRAAARQKDALGGRSREWKECFLNAEEICGWLLLASTDPAWWYHNELRFARQVESDVTREIPLKIPEFIEIVISRSVMAWAKYRRGSDGKAKPDRQQGSDLVFDAISTEASDISLLSGIYRDLLRGEPLYNDREKLLEDICVRAEARFENDHKPIYYLMPRDTMLSLKSAAWFQGMRDRLLGKIQFICCDAPAKPYEFSPTREDQAKLLAHVAEFLYLEKDSV